MSDTVTLWAESVDEADEILKIIESCRHKIKFDEIFVAKRHGRHRTNDYLAGFYYRYHQDIGLRNADVSKSIAPKSIINAVQWTSMDAYITVGEKLVFSAEMTTQLEGNNLFQRLPRAAKAVETGSAVVTLQGSGSKPTDLMLKRLFSTHSRLSDAAHCLKSSKYTYPSLVLYYDSEESYDVAVNLFLDLMHACINSKEATKEKVIDKCRKRMSSHE